MKMGPFIVLSLCAAVTTSHADYSTKAVARSRARDHAGAIELYRKAYEEQSDPKLLVRIAYEFKQAGNVRESLAYFCSYMYIDAAGELASEASDNARAISAQLGKPTQSDHEACETRPPATRSTSVDMLSITMIPPVPSRISKREILGLSGIVGSLAFLGLAVLDGRELEQNRLAQGLGSTPDESMPSLLAEERNLELRQKLFLAAGGAVLVTGGFLYVTGRINRKKADAMMIAPSVGKGGASVTVGRRF